MYWSLFDDRGKRKYLTSSERAAFIRAAARAGGETETFCLTLALTGARISEVLNLTADRVDAHESVIVLETLKRRSRGIYRAIPVPSELIAQLDAVHKISQRCLNEGPSERLWLWGRTTAWKRVKLVAGKADIPASLATPRALRHAFGVHAVREKIALNVIKKWLGHAKIETTAIYADPIGAEERALAQGMWGDLSLPFSSPARRHGAG
jgi:integrase